MNERNDLAEDRTEYAQDRTLLAKERTFAAWLRTGMASMAVGFGVAELLGQAQPAWLARAIGIALVLTGGAIITLGFISFRRVFRRLAARDIRGTAILPVALITAALVAVSIAGIILILGR
jgi:putative membrane protein